MSLAAAGLLTASGCGGSGSGSISTGSLVTMTTTGVPNGTTGVAYTTQFEAEFPHPASSHFILTGGALPPGLSLDSTTGVLSGFPRVTGVFHLEVAARDGFDPLLPTGRDANFAEDRKTFTLNVALGPPHILPQQPPAAQYRASYGYQIDMAGGTPPYVFAQTGGTLPTGLSISPSGLLGSFPIQANQHPYHFNVTVTDSLGLTDSAALDVDVVVLPLIILTSSLPDAAQGFPYDTTLALASPGGGSPYVWSQVAPTGTEILLSSIGMELTPDGHVTVAAPNPGPTASGTFAFSVQVSDEAGQVASRQLTLRVNPGPVLTSINPNKKTAPAPYVVTGLNFQAGAQVIFKPGPDQVVVNPQFVSSTTLQINGAIPTPLGGGAVTVRVRNPDGGFHDKLAAFLFPFNNISFGTKGFLTSALSSTGLAASDLNGDGKTEIVHSGAASLNAYPGGPTSTIGGLHLLTNTGGNSFTVSTLDSGNYYDVKIADVNSDGKPDIVALGQTAIRTWINNPLGTLNPGPVSALPSGFSFPSEMAIGRLNGDAIPDVIFGVSHFSNPNGRLYSMTGTGTGAFTLLDSSAATSLTSTNGVLSSGIIDVNGDGRGDVFAGQGWINGSGPLGRSELTQSSGLFGTWTTTTNAPFSWGNTMSVVTGDFLGTGSSQQFLISHTSDPSDGGNRRLIMFSGSGFARTDLAVIPATLGKALGASDLDFDGKTDWAHTMHTGTVAVWKGALQNVVQTLDLSVGSPTVSNPRSGRVAFGDVDGDGRDDLLVTTSYWIVDYQPNVFSGFQLGVAGDATAGSMGVVFYLNTSN
jgi:hypothetical protein